MAGKACEGCGTAHVPTHPMDVMDYCSECYKDLCRPCMGKGCCGNVPARSGSKAWNDKLGV